MRSPHRVPWSNVGVCGLARHQQNQRGKEAPACGGKPASSDETKHDVARSQASSCASLEDAAACSADTAIDAAFIKFLASERRLSRTPP